MSRQIIGADGGRQTPNLANLGQSTIRRQEGQRFRTARRSTDYLRALRSTDPGQLAGAADLQPVYAAIAAEFGPSGSAVPAKILSRCFLPDPFEVHSLDVDGRILEHYETYTPVPDGDDMYRNLAVHPDYVLIEIYEDRIACIKNDGSVIELGK